MLEIKVLEPLKGSVSRVTQLPTGLANLLSQIPPARAPMGQGPSSVLRDGWVEGLGELQGHTCSVL